MKKFFIPFFVASSLFSPVKANIDRDIAEMCMKAVDFKGCVETMSGSFNKKNMILDEGVSLSEGNSCPLGFAYSGSGYCRSVRCVYRSGRNNPDLGGKDYACGNADFWMSGAIGRLPLEWGSEIIKATFDSKCPAKPPSVGWRSSCTEESGEPLEPHVVGGVRRR